MLNKNVVRAGAVSAAATLMLLLPAPAFALIPDDGDEPGGGLSVAQTLGLYVGLPVLAFLVIAALVMLPSMGGRDRDKQ